MSFFMKTIYTSQPSRMFPRSPNVFQYCGGYYPTYHFI